MKAISKTVAAAIVGAALLGGTGVAVAISWTPAAAAHTAPLAASAIEYGL
jgi:hypothetical protein